MTRSREQALQHEVTHLHRCAFGREPPAPLVARYLEVHRIQQDLTEFADAQQASLRKIVRLELDAAHIEPLLRRAGRRHPLTSKLLVLHYLAECDAMHPELDRRQAAGRLQLLLEGARGVIGLLHGWYLVRRHGLV